MPVSQSPVVSLFSARPDGATSVAVGLAAVLSRTGRVLLIDLCEHRPEMAPLLDVDDTPNLYELSVVARLSPVSAPDLEASVQWREGLGILVGAWPDQRQRREIGSTFLKGLLTTASARFDHVVVDLGRPRPELPEPLTEGLLLWVVAPGPLGMAALDRAVSQLDEQGATWLRSALAVLNRDGRAWRDVGRFIFQEYRMPVVTQVPFAERCWRELEATHSLALFTSSARDRRRYERAHGADSWLVRRALDHLAEAVAASTARAEAVEA